MLTSRTVAGDDSPKPIASDPGSGSFKTGLSVEMQTAEAWELICYGFIGTRMAEPYTHETGVPDHDTRPKFDPRLATSHAIEEAS